MKGDFDTSSFKSEISPAKNRIDVRVPTGFITKDSGERVEYDSGMRRDVNTGKDRFDLIPIPMLKRLAGLYGRGAVKYGDWNWKLANTEEEMNRFKESAFRHFMQWANGEVDEDHAMAVVFNLFGYETTKEKLSDG